jgi:hypothetical protein
MIRQGAGYSRDSAPDYIMLPPMRLEDYSVSIACRISYLCPE